MATRKSISAKFVFTLLLVLAVGQLVGAVLYLNMTHKQLTGLLEKRMQRTVTQVAQVTAEPIINYNYDIIKSYLTNVMADEDLAQVTLTDMNGKVLAEKRQDEVPSDAIQLQQPILLANGKDEPLGTVTLKYLPHTTHRTLIEIFFVILFSQGALLAVVALVLVRLFNSSIKRPVEAINLALSQITGGDLAVSVPVLNKDEIGGIADGVNFLVERLSATIERINRISSSVTMAMGQLQHTFDKVARVVNNQQASTEEVSQALREATEAQQQIIGNTDRLLSISSDNSSALLQMSASSIEIAETTEQLSKNL
ncbi:MAG TPA: methyl-accepting chemotaxis protein, partial [Geobacterales bacterium]|nr:methyl-accepting chemotaxis protein [Geobacterales bacterium]